MQRDFPQLEWNDEVEACCRQIVRMGIAEDLGEGQDWTTAALVPPDAVGSAAIVARAAGVVAGLPAIRMILDELTYRVDWLPNVADGDRVACGQELGRITGRAQDLLTAERPILNIVGRLSGIASLTRLYADAVAGTAARIYDTRKTTPGWRLLEKYAVRQGGGWNHRLGLSTAILIKDNHLALGASAGFASRFSPAEAVRRARQFLAQASTGAASDMIVEVEVDTLDQLTEVLPEAPDIVLLDNMSIDQLHAAVAQRNAGFRSVELEASGGVALATVRQIALTGVDRISVGALTHSAAWLDVAMEWNA